MHHNGCDNYYKFLIFDIQTSLIRACISQYYYKCMISDYQRYNVWLIIRVGIYFYIQLSCSNCKTWFGSPHGTLQFPEPTSWPSSIQESKTLRYTGAAPIINSFIRFHKKMHLSCFSICDPMRQLLLLPLFYVLLPVWFCMR